MMNTPPYFFRTTRQSGGFTLVELLVVIGIIAILAGVALGPITNGIKKAKESSAMQTSRTIALAEFQCANDNNGQYPDGADAGAIGQALLGGSYVTDQTLFYISGDSAATKSTSSVATNFTAANSSYNFTGLGATYTGVGAAAPDQLPMVWSEGETGAVYPAAANTGTAFAPSGAGPFGSDGIAVAYHSNNAFFRAPSSSTAAFPGIHNVMFVDQSFDPAGNTYLKRVGAANK